MIQEEKIPSTRFALWQLLEEVFRANRASQNELKKSSKSSSISRKVIDDAFAALAQGELNV